MLSRGAKTGIEKYTTNLLSHMLPLDKDIKFKLFYNGYKKEKLEYEWLKLPNVELFEFDFPNRILDISSRFLNYPKVDKLLKGVDVMFSPHIFLSSISSKCSGVVTFHDLSFERYPEFYSKSKNYWHYSMNPKKQARKAKKIIAVSESTKNDLVELYNVNPDRVEVIYSGINEVSSTKYQVLSMEEKKTKILNVRKKYSLPEIYILYLGTLEPRKNIIGLVKAYELFRSKFIIHNSKSIIPNLVIAGSKGWLYDDIFETINKSSQKENIILTGFIKEEDKPFLYSLANLFVYPSFYEGFGFPPLEAMSFGVPVITSNISSLPEAVSDAAIMIDPYNLDELEIAMETVLRNDNLKRRLIKKGLKQAKKFQWQNCAEKTLDVLKLAANN